MLKCHIVGSVMSRPIYVRSIAPCDTILSLIVVAGAQGAHPKFSYVIPVLLKDIYGYFQCAPFPRLETGKVVWVLSFDH